VSADHDTAYQSGGLGAPRESRRSRPTVRFSVGADSNAVTIASEQVTATELTGGIHRLRHTFCSILAAEGASPGAIQKLAGHASIATTMKYMHLSPAHTEAAIGLLDRAWARPEIGEDSNRGGTVSESGETVEKVHA